MMALRRSTRAASAKPPSKVAERTKSTGSRKRAASHTVEAPPAKKSRREVENKAPGVNGKDATTKAQKPNKDSQQVQLIPYFNPLPTLPPKTRPALTLFVWGAGNFGQFGMGPNHLDEFDKPKKNIWVEGKIAENAFGDDNASFETAVAGGLHSLFIDEKGSVSKLN
jgi:regulator of chromosome condensation